MLLLDAQDGAGGAAGPGAGPGRQPAGLATHRAEIDQANAYASDRGLADVARDIVARRLRLPPDRDLPPE